MTQHFDKAEIYEAQIEPLVKEIEKICYRERIPMFAAFAIKDDGKETTYCNAYVGSRTVRKNLTQDRMVHFIRVVRGYKVIAPEDETELHFE